MKRIIIAVCFIVILGGQGVTNDVSRLAIFLVKKPSHDLGKIDIADTPLITDADIVSYNWQKHAFALTDAGFNKLPTGQEVGVYGKPFVVVADGKRCYLGAFWIGIYSISHPNPIIDVTYMPENRIVTIQRAYPSAKFARGDDPRSDKRILKVLTELKKLIQTPNKAIDSNKK